MNSEDLMFYINKHKKAYEERVKKEQQGSQNISSADKSTVQANHLKQKEERTENENHENVQSLPQNQNGRSNMKQTDDNIEGKKNVSSVKRRESQQVAKTISQEEADYLFALQLSQQLNGNVPNDVSIDQETPIHSEYWNRSHVQQGVNDKKPYQEDEVRKPDDIYTECLLGNVSNPLYQTNFDAASYLDINLLNNMHIGSRRSFENNKYRCKHEVNKEYKTKVVNKVDEIIKHSKKGEANISKEKVTLPLKNNVLDKKEGGNTSLEKKESSKTEILSSTGSCNDYNRKPGTHTIHTQKEKTKTEVQNKGVDMYYKKTFNEPIYKERIYKDGTILNPIDLMQLSTGNKKSKEKTNTNDTTHNPTASMVDKNLIKKTAATIVPTNMNQTPHRANAEKQNKMNDNGAALYRNEYKNSHVHAGSSNKANCGTNQFHQKMIYQPLPNVKDSSTNFTEKYINTMYINKVQNRNSKNEAVNEEYYKKNQEEILKGNPRNALLIERNENSQGTNIYNATTIRQQVPLQNMNNEKSIKNTKMENKPLSYKIRDLFFNTPHVHTSRPTNLKEENNTEKINKPNIYIKEEKNTKSMVNNSVYPNEVNQKNTSITQKMVFADTAQTQVQKEIINNDLSKDKLIK